MLPSEAQRATTARQEVATKRKNAISRKVGFAEMDPFTLYVYIYIYAYIHTYIYICKLSFGVHSTLFRIERPWLAVKINLTLSWQPEPSYCENLEGVHSDPGK